MEEKKIKFRESISPNGILILAGKNSKNNEELIAQAGNEEFVLHTHLPGSPFVNIKGIPKKEDLKHAAVFCAKYSKDWKRNKNDVIVHVFKGKNIYKTSEMAQGTFGVKQLKKITVKKEDIENFSKEV